MKKNNLNKGAGTFLEFSITAMFLTFILLLIIGIFMRRYAIENFELYISQISRDVIVCESMKDAKEVLKNNVNDYFSRTSTIDDVEAEISYTPGSGTEWKKGNYVTIYIKGTIHSLGVLGNSKYETERMMMIEKSDE